ncbi:MAG TPA: hypothetical protein IAB67_06115 [Candidatus Ventrousia excrementavium]|uniref:Peptidase C39-like domain-containing protein n=1 Tax=Candidatus Ventrousia excrementavium TaxID=2840961 RepID=A0A9D1LL34_9CLOT|nr:hypothetical protein [Candidatus Ventrousia excrementavium]
MVVETLLGYPFPLEKSADFALEHGARVPGGTDMGVLSRALEQGSIAVANVGGDRTGHKGVFSDSGHYLVVLAEAPDGRLVLADPYLYAGKYDKPHRQAVEVVNSLLYAPPDVVDKDAENRSPRYTVFGV